MKKKWIRPRHKILLALAKPVFWLTAKIKYHLKITWSKGQGKRNYFVLTNHQTPMDQPFCSLMFRRPVYYIATEDIFSNGFVSHLLKWSTAPIPIDKTKTDVSTVRTAMRVAREGGNIGLAPEGNRTYSGHTCNMKPSVAKLVRALKLPLALIRFEGGYGVCPRWSDKTRRGKMTLKVSRVVEYDEYSKMTDDELFNVIKTVLWVDDTASGNTYKSRKKAEYLERAVYTCPSCNDFTVWHSHKNEISCTKCGAKVTYGSDLTLTSSQIEYKTTSEWLDAQEQKLTSLTLEDMRGKWFFEDKNLKVSKVFPYKRKQKLYKKASLELYGNYLHVSAKTDSLVWLFDEITGVAVMGHNKLNVSIGGQLYQFKGDKRFNALKFMNFWYHYRNLKEGKQNGFIGI